MIKKLIAFGLGAIFFAGVALAAPNNTFQRNLLPEINQTYDLGSTTPNLQWKGVYTKDLFVSGTCTGCGGSSNTISTTTVPSFAVGNLTYLTGTIPTSIGGVATTTLTATTPLSLSNAISVIGATPSVLTCAVASGSLAGCLSSADWTTFNAKQASGFQIATTSTVAISGLAYFTDTTPTVLGSVATGTVSVGSTALTVTAGRSVIGGALSIDCATSSGSQNGCLSSTDWTTFNGKLGSYDAWTHPSAAKSATTSLMVFNGNASTTALTVSGNSFLTGTTTVGYGTNEVTVDGVVYPWKFAISEDDVNQHAGILIEQNATTCPLGCGQIFARSRGDRNTKTVVSSGDEIGNLWFLGYDGTDYARLARIHSEVDGTPGSNDMPGVLRFYTTPDGSATPLERLTIKNTGNIGIGTTTPSAKLDIYGGLLSIQAEAGTGGATTRPAHLTLRGVTNANIKAEIGVDTTLKALVIGAVEEGVAWNNIVLANNGGNVGIGTTTPAQIFSVGNAFTSGGLYYSTIGLAVGSSTPAFPFAVTPVLSNLASTFYINSAGAVVAYDSTNAWAGKLSPTRSFVLSSASTTAWTASTTGSAYSPYLVMPFAGTLRQVRCTTDTSFLGVNTQIAGSNVSPSYFVASTSVGKIAFTGSNTFTAGQKILANFGTTTTSGSASISCTYDVTETP